MSEPVKTNYYVYCGWGSIPNPPAPGITANEPVAGRSRGLDYMGDLTPEEVLALAKRYDVLLVHDHKTDKTSIYLDTKNGRFRQR